MLPTKFRFIWPRCFKGEDFEKSANQKQELPVAAMFGKWIITKCAIFREDLPLMLPTTFQFIWLKVFRED